MKWQEERLVGNYIFSGITILFHQFTCTQYKWCAILELFPRLKYFENKSFKKNLFLLIADNLESRLILQARLQTYKHRFIAKFNSLFLVAPPPISYSSNSFDIYIATMLLIMQKVNLIPFFNQSRRKFFSFYGSKILHSLVVCGVKNI